MKLGLFVMGLAAFLLFLGCNDRKGSSEIPEELVGTWRTDAPNYKGCYMELGEKTVTFISSQGDRDINYLKAIESDSEGERILYTIHYRSEGNRECSMPFYYERNGQGAIRMKNRGEIEWTRMEDRQ